MFEVDWGGLKILILRLVDAQLWAVDTAADMVFGGIAGIFARLEVVLRVQQCKKRVDIYLKW